MEHKYETFEQRLIKLREEKGYSQDELASKVGITQQTLSRYEKGQRQATIEFVVKAARIFNVSTDYLLGLSDNSTTNPDIKNACEVTGLTESAIKIINAIHNDINNSYGFNISILIENPNFKDMIHQLFYTIIQAQSLASYKKELESMINLSEFLDKTGYTEGAGREYIVFNREYLVSKYRLEEIFKNICNEMTSESTGFEYSDLIKLNYDKEATDNAEHNPTSE